MPKLARVLIMAGGTGGHIFPGLAIAKKLRAEGVDVNWLGTQQGVEAQWVPEAGIPIHFISISGVRGKGIKDQVLAPWRIMVALFQSIFIIRKLKPDVVIGLGGFVSGPGGLACWILGTQLVIHEQNAKPGSTNKLLSKIANRILEAFPGTFKQRRNVYTVGNPVRAEILRLPPPDQRFNHGEPIQRLLVLGGSLGAQAINLLLPKALATLPEGMRPAILHQTGEKHGADTQKAYELAGVKGEIVPFIVEMDKAYSWADMVLCRAGALTIAELCAVGLGAILVPFPYAIDDHQTANAQFMAKQRAAIVVQQADLTMERLANLLEKVVGSSAECVKMAKAAYTLREADSTDKIITICKEIYQ